MSVYKKIIRYSTLFFFFIILTLSILFLLAYYKLTHRIQGSYFNSNGVSIHYTDEGEGTIPVILIHGFAVNADINWRKPGIINTLYPDFKVVALDLRGHGLSAKPEDPSAYGIEMVKDVIRLMDSLKIEKAHIAGYSLGGFIAIKLATLHPERILSLSVLGSGWENPDEYRFEESAKELIKSLENNKGVNPLSTHLKRTNIKPGKIHNLWVRILTRYFNNPKAIIGVIKGIPQITVSQKEIGKLNKIPICIIVGEKDPLISSAKKLKEVLPHSELYIIQGKNHLNAPLCNEFKKTFYQFLIKNPPK